MHIMIQITDHVELYYTVRQMIKKKKKDSVGKIFFFLFPNAQLFTHTLEHTISFLGSAATSTESKQLALKSGSNHAMCFTVVCLFKHRQTLAKTRVKSDFTNGQLKSESKVTGS